MKKLTATKGKTTYELDESSATPGMVSIVRSNANDGTGTMRFHVPRDLFEAYAARRIEEVGRKLLLEAMSRTTPQSGVAKGDE